MLKKYSIFMMLLIVASLIGISSIYQPANVETQPQPQQQPLVKGPSMKIPGAEQFLADKLLLDRLFPQIIKRIDGSTLLRKIDAKTLAAKVLPYLDLNVAVTERPGQTSTIKVGGLTSRFGAGQTFAGCAP